MSHKYILYEFADYENKMFLIFYEATLFIQIKKSIVKNLMNSNATLKYLSYNHYVLRKVSNNSILVIYSNSIYNLLV